jgi:hypothetical protein
VCDQRGESSIMFNDINFHNNVIEMDTYDLHLIIIESNSSL